MQKGLNMIPQDERQTLKELCREPYHLGIVNTLARSVPALLDALDQAEERIAALEDRLARRCTIRLADDWVRPNDTAYYYNDWGTSVLVHMLGPYALIMSDEEIQRYRDQMQRRIDQGAKP